MGSLHIKRRKNRTGKYSTRTASPRGVRVTPRTKLNKVSPSRKIAKRKRVPRGTGRMQEVGHKKWKVKSNTEVVKVGKEQIGKSNRTRDALYRAKKPGKRKTKYGTVYYEYRKNRSDLKKDI